MGKKASKTRPPEDILANVRMVAERVWGPQKSDADGIMSAIHQAYLLVCGESHGRSIEGLVEAAKHFQEAATVVSKERNQPEARIVGSLGEGLALLRAGQFKAAVQSFAEVHSPSSTALVLTTAALCWQAFSMSLAREDRTAADWLKEARISIKALREPGQFLPGLLGLAEALQEFEFGHFAAALAILDEHARAFYSKHQPDMPDLRALEAEALLLRGKILRDLGRYEHAILFVDQAQTQRRWCCDLLGETWGCLEKARIHRFCGEYDRAVLELDLAKALIERSDFAGWRARVADHRGDVFRAQGDLAKADREYTQAERLAADAADPLLNAHLVNSRVRLLEDQGRLKEALQLLKGQRAFCRGKKEYGKYLYLMASIHARLPNPERAESFLKKAQVEFKRLGMRSHEALALNRLAGLYAARGQAAKACKCWSAAFGVAGELETGTILSRLKDAVNRLTALDLLPVISGLASELSQLKTQKRQRDASESQAQSRRTEERHYTGHWFAEIVRRHHWPVAGGKPLPMPPVMSRFAFLLNDFFNWHMQDFGRAPASPDKSEQVAVLCEQAAAEAGCKVSVDRASAAIRINANSVLLRCALESILRGAKTAFGTKSFHVTVGMDIGKPGGHSIAIRLTKPLPVGFEQAEGLFCLEHALDDSSLRAFFDRGYTGDLTLAHFIVHYALWGSVKYDTTQKTICVCLPDQLG